VKFFSDEISLGFGYVKVSEFGTPFKKKVSARGSLLCVLNHFKANETCL